MNAADGVTIESVVSPAEARILAGFAARELAQTEAYISHSEIKEGRSLDGRSFAPGLTARLESEFETAISGGERALLCARRDGDPVAITLLLWGDDGAGLFLVIEDCIVAREMRGRGLGRRLVSHAEKMAIARGARWVWLESGAGNEPAHQFFESAGYRVVSKVFGKRLAD